jgi:hypothetical protein
MQWAPIPACRQVFVGRGGGVPRPFRVEGEVGMELRFGHVRPVEHRVDQVDGCHLTRAKLLPRGDDGQFVDTHSTSIAGGAAK